MPYSIGQLFKIKVTEISDNSVDYFIVMLAQTGDCKCQLICVNEESIGNRWNEKPVNVLSGFLVTDSEITEMVFDGEKELVGETRSWEPIKNAITIT
jgi:hypothetical protein